MSDPVRIYIIWYGNWGAQDPNAIAMLTYLIPALSGSAYMQIEKTYTAGAATAASIINLAGVTFDYYSRGYNLIDADIQAIVAAHAGADLPFDTNGVYLVLTSNDVNDWYDPGHVFGFCTYYCGYHSFMVKSGQFLKYATIGDPLHCAGVAPYFNPLVCEVQLLGPNNPPTGISGADGMASVVAHEINEAISDPLLNAWYDDAYGEENEDKCAYTFGTCTTSPVNGRFFKIVLAGARYLIQRNWVNIGAGYCGLSQ